MAMNHCEIVKDLLPLYIDEACSEDSRRMVEEHLKSCRACKEEYRMMKYPAPAEKRMKDFKVIEEQILKEGKEQIETGVMHKIAGRMLWLDLFLNLLFLLLGTGIRNLFLNATKLPWYGKFVSYEELSQTEHYAVFTQFTGILLASFLFFICDVIILFSHTERLRITRTGLSVTSRPARKTRRYGAVSEYLLLSSFMIKILYAVIMTAVGFLYLYGELLGLCG